MNPFAKLAGAAVIIIAAALSIMFLEKSVTPAYGLEQTIQQGRDCGDKGFASASTGPYNAIGIGRGNGKKIAVVIIGTLLRTLQLIIIGGKISFIISSPDFKTII